MAVKFEELSLLKRYLVPNKYTSGTQQLCPTASILTASTVHNGCSRAARPAVCRGSQSLLQAEVRESVPLDPPLLRGPKPVAFTGLRRSSLSSLNLLGSTAPCSNPAS